MSDQSTEQPEAAAQPEPAQSFTGDVGATMVVLFQGGAASVASNVQRVRIPFNYSLINAVVTATTAPTGANLIVDVNRVAVSSGSLGAATTVFTTQANRPTITAGQNVSTVGAPDTAQVDGSSGDVLAFDVDQVGSTVAGSDLTVTLYLVKR